MSEIDDQAAGVLIGMNTLFLAIAQSLVERGLISSDELRSRIEAYPLEHIGGESTEARDAIIEEVLGYLKRDEPLPYHPEWFRGVIEGSKRGEIP